MAAKLSVDDRRSIVDALQLKAASLKRAINTEKSATVKTIREKELLDVNGLTARVANGELDL